MRSIWAIDNTGEIPNPRAPYRHSEPTAKNLSRITLSNRKAVLARLRAEILRCADSAQNDEEETGVFLRRADFVAKILGRKQPEVGKVERVDPVGVTLRSTAYHQRMMNLRAAPAGARH